MNASPNSPERLEIRALQQRDRIHRTTLELMSKVDHARQQLSLTYNVREHFAVVSIIAAALSFFCGYAVGAAFGQR